MTSADAPVSPPVDGLAAPDPAARAEMIARLREYHRMEAEAEDADDRAVADDLQAVLTDRTVVHAAPSPGG